MACVSLLLLSITHTPPPHTSYAASHSRASLIPALSPLPLSSSLLAVLQCYHSLSLSNNFLNISTLYTPSSSSASNPIISNSSPNLHDSPFYLPVTTVPLPDIEITSSIGIKMVCLYLSSALYVTIHRFC